MGLVTSTARSESLESLVKDRRSINSFEVYRHDNCCVNLQNLHVSNRSNTPLRFTAALLDGSCRTVHKGELELTLDRLNFYYKNTSNTFTIYWPLSCVRWYGGCSNWFVFESGRKSKYGVGRFLFKCKKSRQLVSNLQKLTNYLAQLQAECKTNTSIASSPTSVSRRSESVRSSSAGTRSTLFVRSRSSTKSTPDLDQYFQPEPNMDGSEVEASDDYITLTNPVPCSHSQSSSGENDTTKGSGSTIYISYPHLMNSFSVPPDLESAQPTEINQTFEQNHHGSADTDNRECTGNNNYLVIVPSTNSYLSSCSSTSLSRLSTSPTSCHCNLQPETIRNHNPTCPNSNYRSDSQRLASASHSQTQRNVDLGQYLIALTSHTYVNQTPRLVHDQFLVNSTAQNIYVEEPMAMISSQS